jgi:hypothetical protein
MYAASGLYDVVHLLCMMHVCPGKGALLKVEVIRPLPLVYIISPAFTIVESDQAL